MSKPYVIAIVVFLCFAALFSACTVIVSQDRDTLIKSAEAGSGSARALILGANFWARYFIFCTAAFVAGLLFIRGLRSG